MYPPELVAPMKEELTSAGFEDLTTAEQVDSAITAEGTTAEVLLELRALKTKV
jgi:putative YphP/YqiW family bacilliredoxin